MALLFLVDFLSFLVSGPGPEFTSWCPRICVGNGDAAEKYFACRCKDEMCLLLGLPSAADNVHCSARHWRQGDFQLFARGVGTNDPRRGTER
jgi:hypothetical protein